MTSWQQFSSIIEKRSVVDCPVLCVLNLVSNLDSLTTKK